MYRVEWTTDIVNAITASRQLRQRWLDKLLVALKDCSPLPDINGLGMMARRLGVTVPSENGVITVGLRMHSFHSLAREIPITTEDKPWHENDHDSTVYKCYRLVLAPLIDAGIIHSLQRGYHEFFLSYYPDRVTEDLLKRFDSAEFERHLLAGRLRKQIVSRDHETKELIDVLTT